MMRLRTGRLALLILLASTGPASAQPIPQDVLKAQLAFFSALPSEFPTADIARLKAVVADNLQVFADGKLVSSTADVWIASLQGNAPRGPGFPPTYSISRDKYMRLVDGGVMVREFSYPIAPKGSHVTYEIAATTRHATYYIEGGKLVRIVYGPWMQDYSGLCQVVEQAKGQMTAQAQIYKFCS